MELVISYVLTIHPNYLQASLPLEEPSYDNTYKPISSPVVDYDPFQLINDQYSDMLNNDGLFGLSFSGETIGKGSVSNPRHGKRASSEPSVPWPTSTWDI